MESQTSHNIKLDAEEARVLGCLLEKEMATPDYYPLTLNAIVNACNQKSNRNPVVNYDEATVVTALQRLAIKDLVFESRLSRVPKYEELIMKELNLVPREAAILCVLLLRGHQTVGEIKVRTERLYLFDTLDQVRESLDDLAGYGYLTQIPRKPGQKEDRYGHLFSDAAPDAEQTEYEAQSPSVSSGPPAPEDPQTLERIAGLEARVTELSDALGSLTEKFEAFKREFE